MDKTVIIQILIERLCGLFDLICCAYIIAGRNVNSRRCRIMIEFLLASTIQLFADAAAWRFRGDPSVMGWWGVRISNYLVFIGSFVLLFLGMKYIEQFVVKRDAKIKTGWKAVIYVICVLGIGSVSLSQFTGFIYSFDAQNLYSRSRYFWVVSGLATLAVIVLLVMTLAYRSYMRPIEWIPLILLGAVPLVTSIIQLFYYGLSLNIIGMAAAVIVMFLCYEVERSEKLEEQEWLLIQQELEMTKHQQQITEQEKELTEQKTQLMLSQIKPHFIFNTLASIEAMCEVDPAMARTAIHKFSRYLRLNLQSLNGNSMIPFRLELEYLDAYLWIEKMRFQERLQVEYDLQVKDFDIPSLTLQPIVENAVKHGVCARLEGGTVKIKSWLEGENVIIQVEDDGVGFSEEEIRNDGKVHVGMNNVRERLRTICDGSLEIKSTVGKGTIVRICFLRSNRSN